MTDETAAPSATPPLWIDQRLDRIDEALLGVLPRQERLAVIAGLETRLLKLVAENPELEKTIATSLDSPNVAACRTDVEGGGKRVSSAKQRRSRLALSSGVMGIVAFVLMILSPVIYVLASFVEGIMDGAGEIGAVVLLVGLVFALSVGGLGAVLLGIVSLVKISRSRNQLVGGGWAVTGLCTGPLPMFAGMLGMLILLPLVAEFADISVSYQPSFDIPVSAEASSPAGTCGTITVNGAVLPEGFCIAPATAAGPAACCTAPSETADYYPPSVSITALPVEPALVPTAIAPSNLKDVEPVSFLPPALPATKREPLQDVPAKADTEN